MNDTSQYMVQVGDYDQNTYIIQDANGVPVQYDGSAIISGDITEGSNLITEPRWIQQNSGRGGKLMTNQAFVNGDLVSVNGTGLNLSTRFTPSSIVLNSASGAQFDQDSLRIASAVTGTGGRGRPRGRKPSRGNFPVVPIDMVRQLGIEQQVILQPTVPVATKNKAIQTSTIQMSKKTQCNDIGLNDMTLNTGIVESNTKYIHVPVFVPIPVPVYIPIPTYVREKIKPVPVPVPVSNPMLLEASTDTRDDDSELIMEVCESADDKQTDILCSQIEALNESTDSLTTPIVVFEDKHVISSEDDVQEKEQVKEPEPVVKKQLKETIVESKKHTSQKRPMVDTDDNPSSKQRKLDQNNQSDVKKETAVVVADGCKLKYSYGINAWRHWSKNVDLLKLSVTEINKYMVDFVQKIRKPTNEPYVPDSIFYLCLGIQLFLLDHGNEINLFVDPRLTGFQTELNKILATFQPKLGENHVLVCRIEEDHLWESQQLGSHNPGVLLFTICYLLTRQMKIKTAEEHSRLSIDQLDVGDSEITFRSSTDKQRYVLCKESDSKRCFYNIVRTYIAKCNELGNKRSRFLYLKPLSKTINSGDPWFEGIATEHSLLDIMLNRIRIVKEVQESLLSSN